ncbi:MAG: RNA polymerase factor sigma-54 [Prevotellaceae bacterium]|jgi:RNA polymerase sigma-54 factor|nr:RNA polymerase factor sigma-54 [Prevotellaceae bacterium]
MLKQSLQQKQLQKLSPLQIQTIKLIELPLIQMEERIKKELEENPVLEEDTRLEDNETDGNEGENDEFSLEDYIGEGEADDGIPSYKLTTNNGSKTDNYQEYSTMANYTSLHQMLEEQLTVQYLNKREHILGSFIIGSIDSDGYLRRSLESITDDIAFKMGIEVSVDELAEILAVINTFDPSGVGARDLRECLIIQLKQKTQTRYVKMARFILTECFDDFSKKHYQKLTLKLNIDDETLKEVLKEILRLNPKPGSIYETLYTEQSQQIIPDFILETKNGEQELSLNTNILPSLKISKNYSDIIEDYHAKSDLTPEDKETLNFIRQKIDSAKWFIEAIRQRHHTMMRTMKAIIEFQHEYFKDGDETCLRPMILKDISTMTGYDIATISRVANSKYIQCDWGLFSLRYFFSNGIQTDTGEVSIREVKKIILEHIENEDKNAPMTDEELTQILQENGFNIARRTVAKYREKMNIPVARMRREFI